MATDSTRGMHPKAGLGHLVLKVTDVQLSARFYCEVLGMRQRRSGVFNGERMIFLTFGEHDHDIALLQLSRPASVADASAAGLDHVAFRVGDQIGHLRQFKDHLQRLGIVPERMIEHLYACSIYFRDPDGTALEVYVDCETNTPFVEEEMQVDNPRLRLD